VVFDGADPLDAVGPYEVLATAGALGADASVALVTLEPREEVRLAHGLRVCPDGVLEPGLDVIVVPGGGWADRAPAGAWAEAERGAPPPPRAPRDD
jgi:putative intracellular protease/amidase